MLTRRFSWRLPWQLPWQLPGRLPWVVLGLILMFVLGACGRGAPPPEPVTITFAHDQADTAYYEGLRQTFYEQHPHITVELRPRSWDMLGGLPLEDDDIFMTSQFALNWLLEQERILDLSSFPEQDDSFDLGDFYPGSVDLLRSEGRIWAIPARADLMLIYYNQDLFDRYAAPYPEVGWTWDDFLATALTLRDPSAEIFGFLPNYAPDRMLFDPLLFVYQHGGRIFDDLANPTQTQFDDPLTIEALAWYMDLIHQYDAAPSPEQAQRLFTDYPHLYSAVLENRVGLWMGMLSDRDGAGWPQEWPMRWGAAPLPQGQRMFTLAIVEAYFISAQAEHTEAAWAWLSFLSDQIPNRRAPVRVSLAASDAFEDQVGEQVADAARVSLANMSLLSPRLAEFEDALDVFGLAYDSMLNQRATPEEAMMGAQQQVR